MTTMFTRVSELGRRSTPMVIQMRFKAKIAKMYREPHYDEKMLRAAVEPVFRKDKRPAWETCSQHKIIPYEPHPYTVLLSKDFKEDLATHNFVCFYQKQSIKEFDYKRMRNKLFHAGFLLRRYNTLVANLTFENTKYASLLPLVCDWTEYLFCKEPKVSELLKITKTMPQLILLCGIINDRVLSRDELQEYAQLPSIEILHCELSHTLSSMSSSLVSTISQPSSALSSSLDQLVSEQKKNDDVS